MKINREPHITPYGNIRSDKWFIKGNMQQDNYMNNEKRGGVLPKLWYKNVDLRVLSGVNNWHIANEEKSLHGFIGLFKRSKHIMTQTVYRSLQLKFA